MSERHLTELYDEAFRLFTSHTDEKEVLYRKIGDRIERLGVSSMLDIGAGNGELAIPLSRKVKTYVAVEHKPEYTEALKKEGLKTVLGTFPCRVSGHFDMVLASHSVPWNRHDSGLFLREVIRKLKTGGVFLLITYDHEDGNWKELLESCFPRLLQKNQGRVAHLKSFLPTFGQCVCRTAIAEVRTRTPEDMRKALAFVYSDGLERKHQEFLGNTQVLEFLGRKHEEGEEYRFSFEHIIFEVYP